MTHELTKDDLAHFKPTHATFVGIDSDGCVFDTMEIKQKTCMHTRMISHWQLESIERYLRETAEFINLYSRTRGLNRFPSLLMTFDMLRERPEVQATGAHVPVLTSLKRFIDSGLPLSNATLEQLANNTGDAELASVLAWSKSVSKDIETTVKHVPPFKWVTESLTVMQTQSDILCVSQTPTEALLREWKQHGITHYVRALAGQELGTKADHLQLATAHRYAPEKVLMIGDALGDLRAARSVQGLFYPINPGREVASWERFYKEAYAKFIAGSYAGEYEARLIAEFIDLLPETPPWQKNR